MSHCVMYKNNRVHGEYRQWDSTGKLVEHSLMMNNDILHIMFLAPDYGDVFSDPKEAERNFAGGKCHSNPYTYTDALTNEDKLKLSLEYGILFIDEPLVAIQSRES